MFKFLLKWGLILVAIIVVWSTVSGMMRSIYWWMFP